MNETSAPCEANACIVIDPYGEGLFRVRSTRTDTTMQTDREELFTFFAQVRSGRLDHLLAPAEPLEVQP